MYQQLFLEHAESMIFSIFLFSATEKLVLAQQTAQPAQVLFQEVQFLVVAYFFEHRYADGFPLANQTVFVLIVRQEQSIPAPAVPIVDLLLSLFHLSELKPLTLSFFSFS